MTVTITFYDLGPRDEQRVAEKRENGVNTRIDDITGGNDISHHLRMSANDQGRSCGKERRELSGHRCIRDDNHGMVPNVQSSEIGSLKAGVVISETVVSA
jgi:hypothetical protein